jgi:hypothetical protein
MHSGVLTPDRLGPPLMAEPVAEAPGEALPAVPPAADAPPLADAPPPLVQAPPVAAEAAVPFPIAEAPPAFLPPTGFPGEGITAEPFAGAAPADPFLADAPDESTTFPIGAAKAATRRGRKKMSWSLKNFTKLQLIGCLFGILCNLVLAPYLIYLIWTNLSPSPPPPPSKRAVNQPAPRKTNGDRPTDPDTLP